MRMLEEENGKKSSKRIMGIVILSVMLTLTVYKELSNEEITNMEVFISFLVTAGTMLGITIFEPSKKEIK